jgi:putative hydrolase of the HAD superfamily
VRTTEREINVTENAAAMKIQRGILLDVGVVMVKSAWEIVDDYERLNGLGPHTIPGRGPFAPEGDSEWRRHLEGEITEREYWMAFAERGANAGAPLHGHPHLMRAMFQHPGIDPVRPQATALINDAVAAGLRVGILTNELISFQGEAWVSSTPIFSKVHIFCDAQQLGIAKPDPRPYEIAIERMGIPAKDMVFLDDNPLYVEGGERAGIPSVLLSVLDVDGAYNEVRTQVGLPH